MKIGIIGAGMLGANLTRVLTRAGHAIKLANSRGPDTLADLAAETGATAVTAADAIKDVEAIIISIPQGAIEKLPADFLKSVPADTVIIDTGNYYPGLRDANIDSIEAGTAESVWVSQQLGRPVVKAFNSISFTSLANGGQPSGAVSRIALPVAGDDEAAKAIAMRLVDEAGFDPVDAGSLADSWRQQPGTPTYCTDLDKAGVIRALAMAERARSPERRDQFIAEMLKVIRSGGSTDLIALGRSIYGAP